MYKAYRVYVQGKVCEFVVVNTQTKQVQSSWKFHADALNTARQLNMEAKCKNAQKLNTMMACGLTGGSAPLNQ